MRVNIPASFPGTDAERLDNRATHVFDYDAQGGDARCLNCDARPGRVADWPCGATVPRVDVVKALCVCGKPLYDDSAYCVPCGLEANALWELENRFDKEDAT
jgi:hypothetical protein